jgi:hypothetical protein
MFVLVDGALRRGVGIDETTYFGLKHSERLRTQKRDEKGAEWKKKSAGGKLTTGEGKEDKYKLA